MKNGYATAYMVIFVLELLGWILVGVGAIALVFGWIKATVIVEWPNILIPIALLGVGFSQIAGAQITRAIVATAIDSARAVDVLERIERKLAGAPSAGMRTEPVVAGVRATPDGQPIGSAIKRYKGKLLLRAENGVKVEGVDRVFANVIAAERFIDGR